MGRIAWGADPKGREVELEEQIAEVQRELGMRRKVYPRFVAAGKITQDAADRRVAVLEAVLETLQRLPKRQGALL